MITRGPRQTGTITDRVEALRDLLDTLDGVQLFAVDDPGASGRRGSTLQLWMVRGRLLIVQLLADGQGLDVFYPSPSFQMNDLMTEVRGYVAQGWDALRAGGAYR